MQCRGVSAADSPWSFEHRSTVKTYDQLLDLVHKIVRANFLKDGLSGLDI